MQGHGTQSVYDSSVSMEENKAIGEAGLALSDDPLLSMRRPLAPIQLPYLPCCTSRYRQ